MSKHKSIIPKIILDRMKNGMDWDQLASEAELGIRQATGRIEELKETVKFCRARKKAGDPLPLSTHK
jgi:hypothetical protein